MILNLRSRRYRGGSGWFDPNGSNILVGCRPMVIVVYAPIQIHLTGVHQSVIHLIGIHSLRMNITGVHNPTIHLIGTVQEG